MKIFYVSCTDLKAFYLNYFLKIIPTSADLIIFQFKIFNKNNLFNKKSFYFFKKELFFISHTLNCPLIANISLNKKNNKEIIAYLRGYKLNLYRPDRAFKIILRKRTFEVGSSSASFKSSRIVFSPMRIHPNIKNCSRFKTYIFCDPYGVSVINKKFFKRNFNKFSKIILK